MVRFSWTLPDNNEHTVLLLSGNSTSLYAFYSSKKYSPFHMKFVSVWFSMVLVWRLEKSSIHTMMPVYDANLLNFYGFQVWMLARSALYKRSPSVWMFWNSILHTKTVENQREISSVWRCECFFGGKITYIYTRAKGVSAQQTAAFAAWLVRFGCPAGQGVE